MDEQKKFYLKWPWNWVVCGVFVAAAWHFIGIFSLLLAALFLWWQKKRHPDAVPQGGLLSGPDPETVGPAVVVGAVSAPGSRRRCGLFHGLWRGESGTF